MKHFCHFFLWLVYEEECFGIIKERKLFVLWEILKKKKTDIQTKNNENNKTKKKNKENFHEKL